MSMNEKSIGSNSNLHHFDVGYAALWDKKDINIVKHFKKISDLSDEVKHNHINTLLSYNSDRLLYEELIEEAKVLKQKKALLIHEYENELERCYNDQTSKYEPLQVTKKVDRVVSTGMARIAEFVVGESTQFFNHFACGTGTTPAYLSDITLINEIARISIEIQGYATASGAVIKFGGYFSQNTPSANISESGVFDEITGGAMLFRTVYPINKVLAHLQGQTFFTLSHAIYLSSV